MNKVTIIGAGPAGLTAAYLLTKAGWDVVVLEADSKYVGGISKTVMHNGFRFDIGGHRFFSKSKEINDLWKEILPRDFIERPRCSRIYYNKNLFSYPLKSTEALKKLGLWESAMCVLSYLKAKLFPIANPNTFEDWTINQFGRRLFSIFFKTYTEKVWGMKCREISADWASQRIQNLSLGRAILSALIPISKKVSANRTVKTLINSFHYPRLGPGMMWETMADKVKAQGGRVVMGAEAKSISFATETKQWTVITQGAQGEPFKFVSDYLITTCALRELILMLNPKASEKLTQAANSLRYRDFITVAVMLKNFKGLDDNWIYIHDPNVKVGRIQNFKSWSPEMTPGREYDCLGLEYFCFESDNLWNATNEELSRLAIEELLTLGLIQKESVIDTFVVRQKKAYPVYDDEYARHVNTIKVELENQFPNLYTIGRNGMHRYNNQDHSMMTAILAVKNILAGQKLFDLWNVNQDAEYLESSSEKQNDPSLRWVPKKAA